MYMYILVVSSILFILYPALVILLISDIVLQVTEGNSKDFKGNWKLFKNLVFKPSTLKNIWIKSGQMKLIDYIVEEIRREIPVVKFGNSMTMNSFVLKCLHQNNSVLVVSNNYQICKTLSHSLEVLGKRKNIKLIHTTIHDCKYTIQGVDYDYILWNDVIKQEYILYKKENGRNVLRNIL